MRMVLSGGELAMSVRIILLAICSIPMVLCAGTWIANCAEPDSAPATKAATIDALSDFKGLIGAWRGVGQVKRGSNQGAWQEKAELLWELKPKVAGIRFRIEDGKEWKTAILTYDNINKRYQLTVELPQGSERVYSGKLDGNKLVLEGSSGQDVYRMTLTIQNENRMLVLFEKRPEQQSFYSRVGEVGYQRQGTKIAAVGGTGPVCVVTGGTGTIAVSYQGKTYYVCCTGCKDAFNSDPEGILSDYEKRRANAK